MSAFSEQREWCLIPRPRSEWLENGMDPKHLGPPLYRRTSRGLYAPCSTGFNADGEALTTQRILDMVPLVPQSGALGGWAAAFVHGVDWLDGIDRFGPVKVPIHVGGVGGRTASGCRFVHDQLENGEIQSCHGLPVTTLGRTAFDAVRWSGDLADAVVALDAMLAMTELSRLAFLAELELRSWWPGVRLARAASDLADPAVLSPWESRLRVIYMDEAVLPRPLVNPWIYDISWRFLGRPDLLDPVLGHAIEYDGSYHLDPVQRVKDETRQARLEDVGLEMTRVVGDDFSSHQDLVDRLRRDRLRASLRQLDRSRFRIVPAGSSVDLEGRPVPSDAVQHHVNLQGPQRSPSLCA